MIGEASEVVPAVELINERLPDVVLLDVHLPGGGGRYRHRRRQKGPSGDSISGFVGLGRGRRRRGGGPGGRPGLRDQDDRAPRVGGGDPEGGRRRCGIQPEIGRVSCSTPSPPFRLDTVDPELDLLSDREREVLQLIARGYTYREVGEELGISIKTVESHVSAVLRKLQLSNRNELARWAIERKLI